MISKRRIQKIESILRIYTLLCVCLTVFLFLNWLVGNSKFYYIFIPFTTYIIFMYIVYWIIDILIKKGKL